MSIRLGQAQALGYASNSNMPNIWAGSALKLKNIFLEEQTKLAYIPTYGCNARGLSPNFKQNMSNIFNK